MYQPAAFRETRREVIDDLLRAYPFAAVTMATADGPAVDHLPMMRCGDVLRGHVARGNALGRQGGARALAVFQGPQGYVSPTWYPSKHETGREVPTWNYAVVHVHGRPELEDDAGYKLDLVDRTSAAFEPAVGGWTRQLDAARQSALLNAIVAFRLRPSRLEGKCKINQNKTPADRAQVAAQLRASAHPELLTMAAWMEALDVR